MKTLFSLFLFSRLAFGELSDQISINVINSTDQLKNQSQAIETRIFAIIESNENYKIDEDSPAVILEMNLTKRGNDFHLSLNKKRNNQILMSSSLSRASINEILKSLNSPVKDLLSSTATEDRKKEKLDIVGIREKIQRKFWYAGLGLSRARNIKNEHSLLNVTGGYTWKLDRVWIKGFWSGNYSTEKENHGSFWSLGVGSSYHPFVTYYSPFIYGDIGFGNAVREGGNSPDELSKGFVTSLGLGLTFLKLKHNYFELLFRFSEIQDSNSDGKPNIFQLTAGMMF